MFVPAGTGSGVAVAGRALTTVKRSALERSSATRFITKSILSPLDEAIDLSDDQYLRAQVETDRVLADEGKDPAQRPSGPWLRAARGEDPRRGLLILYPIDPASLDLQESMPAYGMVVSFPTSQTAAGERRLENTVRRREAL